MRTNIKCSNFNCRSSNYKKKRTYLSCSNVRSIIASNLSIDEIYSMTDELIDAHKDYLPKYN